MDEKKYYKMMNWQLKHHKIPWLKIMNRVILWRSVTVEDVRRLPDPIRSEWYKYFTMTTEQEKKWKEKCIRYVMKHTWRNEESARTAVAFMNLEHGLKVDNSRPNKIYHYEL